MGLKCSLFGHAFDERDVVRERDSTGSEVVTIVKDVERLAECGTTLPVPTAATMLTPSSPADPTPPTTARTCNAFRRRETDSPRTREWPGRGCSRQVG